MIHFPKETKGCYNGRIENCCWLCIVRLFAAVIVLKFKKAE